MEAPTRVMDRIMGVITLKAPVYKAIAQDPAATNQGRNIVILVAIVSAVINGLVGVLFSGSFIAGLFGAVVAIIGVLIAWLIGAWALAFSSKTFFQGKTNTQEMLRVTGYTTIFGLIGAVLGVIPCLGALAGLVVIVLQAIGNIIGVREASEFDTTKAILTAIIAAVVVWVITAIISAIFTALGIGGAMLTQPR